jgi:hypothetical protein
MACPVRLQPVAEPSAAWAGTQTGPVQSATVATQPQNLTAMRAGHAAALPQGAVALHTAQVGQGQQARPAAFAQQSAQPVVVQAGGQPRMQASAAPHAGSMAPGTAVARAGASGWQVGQPGAAEAVRAPASTAGVATHAGGQAAPAVTVTAVATGVASATVAQVALQAASLQGAAAQCAVAGPTQVPPESDKQPVSQGQ